MDFHQLQYFNTVATLENMSKAAEILHISQPTLSKYIAKLEDEIGYELFDRNGKKITLNKAGQEFLNYSIESLHILDSGVKKVSDTVLKRTSALKICIIGDCKKLIKYAISYASQHPSLSMNIEEYIDNINAPDINNYDIIVCPNTQKYEAISGIPLYENKAYLAVPSSNPLYAKVSLSAEDLNGLAMVYLKQDNALESAIWGTQILDIRPKVVHFVNSRYLQKKLIEGGVGCGFIYEDSLSLFKDSKNIRLIPITDRRFSMAMKICFKREKHLNDDAKQFIQFIVESFNL